jgi:hypothetical protein
VTLAVTAATEECYCGWRLEVNLLVEGEQQTLVIDDEGEPFRTSAMVENPDQQLDLLHELGPLRRR